MARPHVQTVGQAQAAEQQGPDLGNHLRRSWDTEDVVRSQSKTNKKGPMVSQEQRGLVTERGLPTCGSVMRPEGMGR